MHGWWYLWFCLIPIIFIILLIAAICFRNTSYYPYWRRRRGAVPVSNCAQTGGYSVYTVPAASPYPSHPPPYTVHPQPQRMQNQFVSQELHPYTTQKRYY